MFIVYKVIASKLGIIKVIVDYALYCYSYYIFEYRLI